MQSEKTSTKHKAGQIRQTKTYSAGDVNDRENIRGLGTRILGASLLRDQSPQLVEVDL